MVAGVISRSRNGGFATRVMLLPSQAVDSARNHFRPGFVYHYSVDRIDPTTAQAPVTRLSARKFAVARAGSQLKHHATVFRDPMFEALAALRAHKLRSALTLLGVTLSVAVLVLVVSIITGANLYIEQRVANMGSNVFLVLRFPRPDFPALRGWFIAHHHSAAQPAGAMPCLKP